MQFIFFLCILCIVTGDCEWLFSPYSALYWMFFGQCHCSIVCLWKRGLCGHLIWCSVRCILPFQDLLKWKTLYKTTNTSLFTMLSGDRVSWLHRFSKFWWHLRSVHDIDWVDCAKYFSALLIFSRIFRGCSRWGLYFCHSTKQPQQVGILLTLEKPSVRPFHS